MKRPGWLWRRATSRVERVRNAVIGTLVFFVMGTFFGILFMPRVTWTVVSTGTVVFLAVSFLVATRKNA